MLDGISCEQEVLDLGVDPAKGTCVLKDLHGKQLTVLRCLTANTRELVAVW